MEKNVRIGWIVAVACFLSYCLFACGTPTSPKDEGEDGAYPSNSKNIPSVSRTPSIDEQMLPEEKESQSPQTPNVSPSPETTDTKNPKNEESSVPETPKDKNDPSSSDGNKQFPDPFVEQPDTSEGLVNVSDDLESLLENGQLKGACDRYKEDKSNRKLMLMCGKYMYFYESFGTLGVPSALVNGLLKHFTKEVGIGFSKYGLIPDPTSKKKFPLGFAVSTKKAKGNVQVMAMTCASCHFGKMPDGRYAVGAANHLYDYGKHMLALTLFPSVVSDQTKLEDLDPDVQKVLQPLAERAKKAPLARLQFLASLLPLMRSMSDIPEFPEEIQKYHVLWPKGTMDFLITPLPYDDKVHVVTKIIPLWDIPTPARRKTEGMEEAFLGWAGHAVSLDRFLKGFVLMGEGPIEKWGKEEMRPLAEYIQSLQAPKNLSMPPKKMIQAGKSLFMAKGCVSCHQGPGGSGLRVYEVDEIGTDARIGLWLDPEKDGEPCCGIELKPDEKITYGVKSPRLTGLWAQSRFLHNGSLSSLEELFCLNGPRPESIGDSMGTGGHRETCDGLTQDEKLSLIAFLKSI